MKLPTDPQERNDERALWAQVALAAFVAETSTDENTAFVEFLVGVMHWCDRTGESFDAQLERARSWYSEETSQAEVRRCRECGLRRRMSFAYTTPYLPPQHYRGHILSALAWMLPPAIKL